MARYALAAPHVAGKRVLDVACGTGYGVALLAKTARHVVGVDVDDSAIAAAREAVRGERAEIIHADGTKLPVPDGHFDVITSFETIEHLEQRGAFAAELARVLSHDGVLFLSTPNAIYTRPVNGKPVNRFHLFEYLPEQLEAELSRAFPHVEIEGQFLSSRFLVPPYYWDQREVTDPVLRAAIQLRRPLGRLPDRARDAVARALWGHDFFPRATDYRFSPAHVERSQTLVAICRKQQGTSI